MFFGLALIIFICSILSLCTTPVICCTAKHKYKWFNYILIGLFLAQFFMYYPGSDVSPWAYTNAELFSIRFFGLTVSSYMSIAVAFFCLSDIVINNRVISKKALTVFCLAILPNIWSLLASGSILDNIDYMLKMSIPFLVFLYLSCIINTENIAFFKKIVSFINILLVGQVLVCRLIEHSFSAYSYYLNAEEEYFGYYNQPHPFTCLLAILCFWNVYAINKRENVILNLVLVCANILLIYLSSVRTYAVSLMAGFLYIGVMSLVSSKMKKLRKYVIIAFIILIFLLEYILTSFLLGHGGADISTGRFERWQLDLKYIFNEYSLVQFLFGNGMRASFEVNNVIFGTYINSLNLFVDMLIDYGLIGLFMMSFAYYKIFAYTRKTESLHFNTGLLIFFIFACIINHPASYITCISLIIIVLFIFKHDKAENNFKVLGVNCRNTLVENNV